MNKKCAECGDEFSCDNDISCWCAEFPKLSSDEIDDSCTPATVLFRELKAGNGCTPATVLR